VRWIEQEVLDGDEVVLKAVTGGNFEEILKSYYLPAMRAQLNSASLLLREDPVVMLGERYIVEIMPSQERA
jgi:hypothetical protein